VNTAAEATVHATAVLTGRHAVLVRGAAGSGKSRLALALLDAARTGALGFARLVGDDRVMLNACHGRLLVQPPDGLAGMIEVRGLGIRRVAYEPAAVVGLVVDLAAADASRLPEPNPIVRISGIALPRLAVAAGENPLPAVLAKLGTAPI
jgi:HPr kinase/phosphorylase